MHRSRLVAVTLFLAFAGSATGSASYLLFQHGGQGTAQAGAFTARAEGASAVHYNPAALVRGPRQQIQLGADFTAPRDDFESAAGKHPANHVITLAPAFYGAWRPWEDRPLAFGLGLDSAAWHILEWDTALFPDRFVTRRQEVTVLDLHPVVAYGLDDRWSVGLGAHLYFGTLGFGNNRGAELPSSGDPVVVEVERLAETDATGYGLDLSLHYGAESFGWGLVLDSGGELDGDGDVTYRPRDVPADPIVQDEVARRFVPGDVRLSFELPWSVRTGAWWALYPALRLELDLAFTGWSATDGIDVSYGGNPFNTLPEPATRPEWDDTVSVHLGAEGDLGERWLLSGGLAWVPSPVPKESFDPGFPRGDAVVYAIGFGYRFAPFRFDIGYSFHDHEDVTLRRFGVDVPSTATYSARNQVFSFSVGWGRE